MTRIQFLATFFISSISLETLAQNPNQPTLPTGGSGLFGDAGTLMQSVANFYFGPWMLVASALLLSGVAITWLVMKNTSWIDTWGKGVGAAIVLLNIPAALRLFIF